MKTCTKCKTPKEDEEFYRVSGRQCRRSQCRDCLYNDRTPAARRKTKLLHHFGLTPEGYDALFAAQKGVCAICGKPETSAKSKHLSVDHCHATGKIRGLLCNACNTAIGMLKDSVPTLASAIHYLTRNSNS